MPGPEALKQAVLDFPSVVPLLADKAEIILSTEVRSQPAFRIYTQHEYCVFLPSITSPNTSRAAAVWLENPYCIYCHLSTSNDRMLSGRTQSGHLGSPRPSQNWFGRAHFRLRLLPPKDSRGYRTLWVATATLSYLYTDTWLCLALLLKLFSISFRRTSSTATTWHATRFHRRALKADTMMNFSAELKTHLRPFTAVAAPHKRNAYLNGLFQMLRSGGNCR
jgi:hypothetical protein